MPRPHGGHRSLTVLRKPDPQPEPTVGPCLVCDDRRVVLIVRSLDPALTGGGPSQCPKCCGSVVRPPIPIYTYSPYSGDLPEGGDAA